MPCFEPSSSQAVCRASGTAEIPVLCQTEAKLSGFGLNPVFKNPADRP